MVDNPPLDLRFFEYLYIIGTYKKNSQTTERKIAKSRNKKLVKNIELWEAKQYENDYYIVNPIKKTNIVESIKTLTGKSPT